MDRSEIARLRALRTRAQTLNEQFVHDISPFLKADHTFHRLPKRDVSPGVSVTTTCTCLMAGALVNRLQQMYPRDTKDSVFQALSAAVEADWQSSGLAENNSFTTVLVLRAAGLLKRHSVLSDGQLKTLRHKRVDLVKIIRRITAAMPGSFSVGDYPPKAAIAYWFIDAAEHLGAHVHPARWRGLADWVSREFATQLSYVTARHDALLDPVAMIMAACLIERMRKMAKRGDLTAEVARALVPPVELRHGIDELFGCQSGTGIWPKYFPLFHYKDAGANYCFNFEFLEALLNEFGDSENKLFDLPSVLPGLEKAVFWCEQNRMAYRLDDTDFLGWNSGGQIHTLRDGIPESWATATVHMFLAKLSAVLSGAIDDAITAQYSSRHAFLAWDRIIDVGVKVSGITKTVKTVIEEEITNKLKGLDRRSLRSEPISGRCSALLFGPPGTSKTTFVRAIAAQLQWPYIEINPSDFLNKGLEQIYARTDEIFSDLMDLSGAVVLFDEMDALVESRSHEEGQERLDAVRQLLTTSMLPKLAALRDRARVVFFMATNHRKGLDQAITRSGRFDLLLCVGPPVWRTKLRHLDTLYKLYGADVDPAEIRLCRQRLSAWRSRATSERLGRFTIAEVKVFFEFLIRKSGRSKLSSALDYFGKSSFVQMVEEWAEQKIALRRGDGANLLSEYEADAEASALQ